MITKPNKIVVVRVSAIDRLDPIEEVENVISRAGYCWFGKYGRPMAHSALKAVGKDQQVFVILTYMITGTGRKTRTYQATDVLNSMPVDRTFPKYYKGKLARIRTWVRLEASEQIPIEQIYTKSSNQPVTTSLMESMASHFLCYRRPREERRLVG